jgi:hypothetical protein
MAPPDTALYRQLCTGAPPLGEFYGRVLACAEGLWADQYLSKFTAHGLPHIAEVMLNLDALAQLFPTQGDERLKPEEILVLLSACCLHDIGMQSDADDARADHATLSRKLIEESDASSGKFGGTILLRFDDPRDQGRSGRTALRGPDLHRRGQRRPEPADQPPPD